MVLGGTEPRAPEFNHLSPVKPDKDTHGDDDEVADNDMGEEDVSSHVLDGQRAENIAFLDFVLDIIDNIYGGKNPTCEKGDNQKEPTQHSPKTEVSDSVKTDFVKEFRLLGVKQGRQPPAQRIGDLGWRLVAFVILDLGLIDDLERG